ncbi:unnamed protein product, partial [Meganyctiphanes norvegica]
MLVQTAYGKDFTLHFSSNLVLSKDVYQEEAKEFVQHNTGNEYYCTASNRKISDSLFNAHGDIKGISHEYELKNLSPLSSLSNRICWFFNQESGCKKGLVCAYLHMCSECNGKHTQLECSGNISSDNIPDQTSFDNSEKTTSPDEEFIIIDTYDDDMEDELQEVKSQNETAEVNVNKAESEGLLQRIFGTRYNCLVCQRWINGIAAVDEHIKEKSHQAKLKTLPPLSTRMCNFFNTEDGCRNGSSCMYLHKTLDWVENQNISGLSKKELLTSFDSKQSSEKSSALYQALVIKSFIATVPVDLHLTKGEVITIIHKRSNGWCKGTNAKGKTGHFPSDNVEIIVDDDNESCKSFTSELSNKEPSSSSKSLKTLPLISTRMCHFFDTEEGCRNGSSCKYLHKTLEGVENQNISGLSKKELSTSFDSKPSSKESNVSYKALVIKPFIATVPVDLDLTKGEVITIINKRSNGWCKGINAKGKTGHFHSDNVEIIHDDDNVSGKSFTSELSKNEPSSSFNSKKSTEESNTSYQALVIQSFIATAAVDLDLTKGEIITIIHKRSNGWCKGTNDKGKTGYFPSDNVKIILDDDNESCKSFKSELSKKELSSSCNSEISTEESNILYQALVIQSFIATAAVDLDLIKGEIINIIHKRSNGWCKGTNDKGKTGYFPSDNVKIIPDDDNESCKSFTSELSKKEPSSSYDSEKSTVDSNALSQALVIQPFIATEAVDLSLTKGEVITIIHKRSNGWCKGTNDKGKTGYFPSAKVEIILDGSSESCKSFTSDLSKKEPSSSCNSEKSTEESNTLYQALVIQSFIATEEVDLDLTKGEVITIIHRGSNGWCKGTNAKGKTGYFPSVNVEISLDGHNESRESFKSELSKKELSSSFDSKKSTKESN